MLLLLVGVLVERRILSGRAAPADARAEASKALVKPDPGPLPGLRRIVLDPCTGLEKPGLPLSSAKAD